ncbi:MAG: hypothetical protein DRI65_13835, partial [Chloroflexota bacterium]
MIKAIDKIIKCLDGKPDGLTTLQLITAAGISRASITGNVPNLIRNGYVKKEIKGRVYKANVFTYTLTAKGHKALYTGVDLEKCYSHPHVIQGIAPDFLLNMVDRTIGRVPFKTSIA